MEDYIKRQIDMIGQILLMLARKLGVGDGNVADVPVETVQDEILRNGFDFDVNMILSEEHPVAYMVGELQFSNEALETFTQIVMSSDAPDEQKDRLLGDVVDYLDNSGYFSFLLHSYLN